MGKLDAVVIQLRLEGFSQSDIAKQIGRTSSHVSGILCRNGIKGRVSIPQVNPELSNEELVLLGVPAYRIPKLRKSLGVKRPRMVDRTRRREELAKYLFGEKAVPGPTFVQFIDDMAGNLSPKRSRIIRDFYVLGKEMPKGISTDLTYRVDCRKRLKDTIVETGLNLDDLILRGVIDGGNSFEID